MRTAIYARYSSDNQRDDTIEGQLRVCREHVQRQCWTEVGSYDDRAISGASMMRAGIKALIKAAGQGRFDVILCESLDRLSRDMEDIAGFYKRMRFLDVRIFTLAEGWIDEMRVGFKGTMGALFLKDLAAKTRRGLHDRVADGKNAGGNCYGYTVQRRLGADGKPIRGDRTINPEEAAIVRRIFEDFAAGKSPKRIAVELNREGIPSPAGKGWGFTAR